MRAVRVFKSDLRPVIWQHRTKDRGKNDQPVWKNYSQVHSRTLTDSYLARQQHVRLSAYIRDKLVVWNVDLKTMRQSRSIKERQVQCLNSHGEPLRPLNEVDIFVGKTLSGKNDKEIGVSIQMKYSRRVRADFDVLTNVMSSNAEAEKAQVQPQPAKGTPSLVSPGPIPSTKLSLAGLSTVSSGSLVPTPVSALQTEAASADRPTDENQMPSTAESTKARCERPPPPPASLVSSDDLGGTSTEPSVGVVTASASVLQTKTASADTSSAVQDVAMVPETVGDPVSPPTNVTV